MSDDQHLRKNEYEYWLCPLCGHALLYGNEPKNLYCPTMADVFKASPGSGVRWHHFTTGTSDKVHPGDWKYTAVIPPFYFQWYKEHQTAYVYQFGDPKEDWRRFSLILTKTCSEEELFKLYQRFNNLKVFA